MKIDLRIVQWRKKRGMTQTELAEKCKTTQQTIAKIEMGTVDPKLTTIQKIADALDCDIVDLFYTREEFAKDVNDVAQKLDLNLNRIRSVDLNNLCWQNAFIPPFHPFWSQYKVKNNKIFL